MALEVSWNGKLAYLRIESIFVHKGSTPSGLRSGIGGNVPTTTSGYGQLIRCHIYEDSSAAKLLSIGEYALKLDIDGGAILQLVYEELKKLPQFEGARNV